VYTVIRTQKRMRRVWAYITYDICMQYAVPPSTLAHAYTTISTTHTIHIYMLQSYLFMIQCITPWRYSVVVAREGTGGGSLRLLLLNVDWLIHHDVSNPMKVARSALVFDWSTKASRVRVGRLS